MNTKLILLALSVAAFSSCTTLYKSGQTPDDVYYSPVRTYGEGAVESRQEREEEPTRYYADDAAIRMGITDPRWRYLDYNYGYNSFNNYGLSSFNYGLGSLNYGFNSGFYNHGYDLYGYGYNPYSIGFNNGFYSNPYYWPYHGYQPIFVNPSKPRVTTPRTSNLGGYGAVSGYNNVPARSSRIPARTYSNTNNNGTAVGNALRKVLGSDNTNNNNTRSNPNTRFNNNNNNNNNRTYTPANNNSSNSSGTRSSGTTSGGGGISRPPRRG